MFLTIINVEIVRNGTLENSIVNVRKLLKELKLRRRRRCVVINYEIKQI